MLQRLFDRDLYAARNMLHDLRERGLLEKLGTARGGTGVRYGPGPKFPASTRPTDARAAPDAQSVSDQLRLSDADSDAV